MKQSAHSYFALPASESRARVAALCGGSRDQYIQGDQAGPALPGQKTLKCGGIYSRYIDTDFR